MNFKGEFSKLISFNKTKLCLSIIFICLAFFCYTGFINAAAGIPKILNFQGRLLDSNSDLLGGSSGTDYCFRFSIHDDETVGAGNQLWPSDTPSTMTIEVKSGVFNAGVGDTSASGDELTFNFYDTDEAYLNIEVGEQVSDSCATADFENLEDRQRIFASGYAITASTVFGTGYSAMGTTTPATNTVLTIGATSTVATPLTIRGYTSQSADLLRIENASSEHLLSINSSGGLFVSSTLYVGTNDVMGFIVDSNGRVGVGTSTASNKFNVLDETSNPQFRLSNSDSNYGEFYIDSAGDMRLSTQGKNIRMNDENLWVCDGGGCDFGSPSGQGNIIVENAVYFDNGFYIKEIGASTTMYDSANNAILQFDENDS
ncbi:hypothetical protein ACFL29_02140 [Patescibacteria group bacterium]